MIRALVFDFSQVLLFAKDRSYTGKLNDLYRGLPNGYTFWDYFMLNDELVTYLETIHSGYTLAIFTTEFIQNDPAVRSKIGSLFSSVFSASELGLVKKDPAAYTMIANKLGFEPSSLVYVDDREENVDAAKQAGLQSFRFVGTREAIKDLEMLLRK